MNSILISAATAAPGAQAQPLPAVTETTSFHKMEVDGVGIFYREAGPKDAPTIVLLHGFPSSSRQFDKLIPFLATRYHIVAPDYPSFGLSDTPDPSRYGYTFDHLAQTVSDLLGLLKVDRYTLYVHDYGAPVGFRMMMAHPERIQALIDQNGNAYREGLGPKWSAIEAFWADPDAHPDVSRAFLSFDATKQRHLAGTSFPDRYDPSSWTDEYAHLQQPGQFAIQSALLYDYRTNVASYPEWQAWLRRHQPPTLVVWGKNDPSFIAPGGEAFRRDLPKAEIHMLDAGHWVMDEKADELAAYVLDFMRRTVG